MIKLTYAINNENFCQELHDGHYIVGRSKSCDIVIREPSISGQHVRIDVDGGMVSFRDLLSRNGTQVNGVKKSQGDLRDGQVLRLGHVDINFSSDVPVPAAKENSGDGSLDLAPPPPAGGDDFAAPPPLAPAPADEYALATYQSAPPAPGNAPAVFEAEASGAEPQPANRRPILYAIAAVFVIAVIGLAVVGQIKSAKPGKNKVKSGDADVEYWTATRSGADDFEKGQYANAVKTWLAAESAYKKNSTLDSVNVAKTFSDIATPFMQAAKDSRNVDLKVDWLNNTTVIRSFIDTNVIGADMGLDKFAMRLSERCLKESANKDAIIEAQQLRKEKNWNDAIKKFQQVMPESLYYDYSAAQVEGIEDERKKNLKDDALAAARSGDYAAAVAAAVEFESRGGKDDELLKSVQNWRNIIAMNKELEKVKTSAESADSIDSIQAALRLMKQFQTTYPNNDSFRELSAIETSLNEKLYIVRLQSYYKMGDSQQLAEHLKKSRHGNLPQVRSIQQKWENIKAELEAADAAEKKSKLEEAIAAWKRVLQIEADTGNSFHKQAADKIAQYPADVLGKMFAQRSDDALNAGKLHRARVLLKKAADYGVDVKAQLKGLNRKGITLFNQGISDFNQGNFSAAHEKINDAMDCFLATDDFYPKIERWMTANNVARRKPQ